MKISEHGIEATGLFSGHVSIPWLDIDWVFPVDWNVLSVSLGSLGLHQLAICSPKDQIFVNHLPVRASL